MFIAQGHLGRTTISCDLGRTWIADRSDVGPLDRCWTAPPDGGTEYECDHQPTAGRGVAFGNGWIVANFGWGPAGGVRRSRDGVQWTVVKAGENYANTVYVGGRFLEASNSPDFSDDDGTSWRATTDIRDPWTTLANVRRAGGGVLDGGALFVMSGDNGLAVSARAADGGVDWLLPPSPSTCRAGQTEGGVAVGNGVVVLINNGATACVSTDRGASWAEFPIGGTIDSQLVFTGAEFIAWGTATNRRSIFRSADGQTWTSAATATLRADGGMQGGPELGPVAYGAGVFVAVNGAWGQWYEQQQFFRSADGVTWEALPRPAFNGSHPIRFIAFGEAHCQ